RNERRGAVRLIDYMPWTNDPRATIHEVHRRIECVAGTMELDVIFDPHFGYAESDTRGHREPHGLVARGAHGGKPVVGLTGGGEGGGGGRGGGGVGAPRPPAGGPPRLRLTAGARRWMVLSWGTDRPEPISAYRPFDHLRATRQAWRDWAAKLRYDGPWRHHVL